MNDIRFMIYLDYLQENKFIKYVIISDAADVEFNSNIFNNIIEDKLYVCYDRNRTFEHYYLKNRINLTYKSMIPFEGIMNRKALQAGLFAGSYDMVIKCLTFMKQEFDTLVDKTYNTNYIVYNHVIYTNMFDYIFLSSEGTDIKTKCGNEIIYLTWKL